MTSYIPHDPTPRQAAFLAWNGLEGFYGGAAGGGKSDALLMGALQYVDQPNYQALLLRRTFRELRLPGGLMDRSFDWLSGTAAKWRTGDYQWVFPSGATVTFGYLEHGERDRIRYQGAEFQYIGFDELTHFAEADYLFLLSRLRRLAASNVPLRMRGASNPGGPGHDWVRQRFLIEGRTEGRIFIPAKLADNPYLDREAYESSLSMLDPVTRARLLAGDWEARPKGAMFDRSAVRIVEPHEAPPVERRVRRWDLAATEALPGTNPDWTAGVRMGRTEDGVLVIDDVVRTRSNPGGVDELIFRTAERDGYGTEVTFEQEPGSSGIMVKGYYTRHPRLSGYIVRFRPTTGPKEERARPFAAQWYAGNVVLVRGPWLTDFLNEIEVFPDPRVHDDQVDAATGGYEDLAFPRGGTLVRRQAS